MKSENDSFAALFESSQAGATRPRRHRRGDRLDVTVVALGRDAVFVDLGGKQEGYFDRSAVLLPNGKLSVDVGTTVQAIVVEADGERVKLSPVAVRTPSEAGRIEAGGEIVAIPRAPGGPLLVEGAHVRGAVTGVERYGVFLQIAGTQGRHGRGLIPTAETATPRGADLRKLFPVGMELEAKILAIQEDGKIRLSIKALGEDVERREFESYKEDRDAAAGAAAEAPAPGGGAPKKPAKPPAPRSLGTLGDLLAKRRG